MNAPPIVTPIGPRERRDAMDRHTQWLLDTDTAPRTPERVAEIREQARARAERHDSGESRGRRN